MAQLQQPGNHPPPSRIVALHVRPQGPEGPTRPLVLPAQVPHLRIGRRVLEETGGELVAPGPSAVGGVVAGLGKHRHIPNLRPPRYTYAEVGNKYTRVPTYVMNAATKGKKAVLNPDYISADYEAAVVLNPSVFTSEIVPPVNSAGGVSWNPTSYMGEWKWVTGGSKIQSPANDCEDPLDKLGRHFAEFKHAARPEFPNHGMSLIFKRACKDASGSVTITDVTACSA